jgi:arginyl-tRNA synthetase
MVTLNQLSHAIISCIAAKLSLTPREILDAGTTVTLLDATSHHTGDLTTNAAMTLARLLKKPPRMLAELITQALTENESHNQLLTYLKTITIAGPGFINITVKPTFWSIIARTLQTDAKAYFQAEATQNSATNSYLIEFVSANPTGPLHLGHGRNAIIGSVLERVLTFAGHAVHTEFYINDAGVQMNKLGASLKARCLQNLGHMAEISEEGYHGEYLITLAEECVAANGSSVIENEVSFFTDYAQAKLIEQQKQELAAYGVTFNRWFSERTLHANGSITTALEELERKGFLYTKDGALWFKSTEFGDDKDRVIRKQDGSLTYIAPDIAYHVDKLSRGFQTLINIVGQDHHGYILRLKGTLAALGYDPARLDVILYQLVSLKQGDTPIKMSKRSGTFIGLQEVVDTVGVDAARFFFLHKKADSHLELDIDIALKQTQENPVFYLQYAYVRTLSIAHKAAEAGLAIHTSTTPFTTEEIVVLKKLLGLSAALSAVTSLYATHTLAQYALDLAQTFHTFYTNHKVIDLTQIETSSRRLMIVHAVNKVLALTLDLLGLSKPESM